GGWDAKPRSSLSWPGYRRKESRDGSLAKEGHMVPVRRGIVALVMIVGWFALVASGSASAAVSCSLYASPSGSDSGSGSSSSPFLTAQKLVDALQPGQTGCLMAGTYSQPELRFNHGGSSGAPITLASYPGQTATVSGGFVYVVSGSNYVTIENLHMDASAATQVGVQVMASNTSLIGDDITNGHGH